jgi:hypothetical protein
METFHQKLGHKKRRPVKKVLVSNCQKEAGSFQKRYCPTFSYSSAIATKLTGPGDFWDDEVT